MVAVELHDARVREGVPDRLAAPVRSTLLSTRDELVRTGALHPRAALPDGVLPVTFAEELARAIARGGAPAELARRHYTETMPRAAVVQLAGAQEPNATLLHTPLDTARLPRLRAAVAALAGRLRVAAVDEAVTPLAAPAWRRLRAGDPVTVAELYAPTYYGGFMPLLYGTPADLARVAAGHVRRGSLESAIDAHLTAPLVHELTHLGRARRALLPLHLDECMAGYFGVTVHRPFGFPGPDDEDGVYATPWFSQIGQALCRVTGAAAALRAHAGQARWEDVLPPGLTEAAARLGAAEQEATRSLHFLSDNTRPDRWQKLFFLCAAGRAADLPDTIAGLDAIAWRDIPPPPPDPMDDEILADGRAALRLRHRIEDGAHVVDSGPPVEPVLDLERCRVEGGGESYLYPPTLAARARSGGA